MYMCRIICGTHHQTLHVHVLLSLVSVLSQSTGPTTCCLNTLHVLAEWLGFVKRPPEKASTGKHESSIYMATSKSLNGHPTISGGWVVGGDVGRGGGGGAGLDITQSITQKHAQ